MQYLLNTAQFPRVTPPRAPVLVDADDDAGALQKADELVALIRGEGAEKVRVQIRRAVNLALVGHAGDAA